MLSVADMAGMRRTLTSSLPTVCAVITDTATSDGAGGQTYVRDPNPATFPCRVAPRLATGTGQLKDAETQVGGRIIAQAPWLITFPAGVVVNATNHIIPSDGREFEVFAVLARRSDEIYTGVLCRLINDGLG